MNINLLNAVKETVKLRGETVLSNPKLVSAFLADLAKDVPKPQKNALLKCLEHGFVQVLKNSNKAERANTKQRLAKQLHNEEGLDLGLCGNTLDLLETVLFGTVSEKPTQPQPVPQPAQSAPQPKPTQPTPKPNSQPEGCNSCHYKKREHCSYYGSSIHNVQQYCPKLNDNLKPLKKPKPHDGPGCLSCPYYSSKKEKYCLYYGTGIHNVQQHCPKLK